jgi:LuxR family transcriptional regulator, maltose regulon positive regulatory protein
VSVVDPPVAAPSRAARYRPPAVAGSELRRERLLRLLADDPAPVTLVCAPAGSGKTSLLASWVAATPDAAVAWLNLDDHDDDPGPLWSHILGALRATGRFSDQAHLHELVAPAGEVGPGFVEAVVEEVAALREPVYLVLDDVHVLRHRAVLDSLALLVRRLHPSFHLVLASRSDPPIGLPRLRLEHRLRELRAAELALTPDETSDLLAGAGLRLPESELACLQERTEGWVAGIAIAAMALQVDDDPASFVERFGGDDHAVADYLLTEVLTALPGDRRSFLLRTSVCGEMSVDLAERLTGRPDAAVEFDELERTNIFTRRLGRTREVYRYHDLWRAFLAAELRRTDAALERELHAVAAAFHEQRGDQLHAMEHLAQADDGDLDHLVALADAHGLRAVLDGQGRRFLHIAEQLHGHVERAPVVALLAAAAAMEVDELDRADRWLLGIDLEHLVAAPDRALAALAASVGVSRARYAPRIDVALSRLEATIAGATGDRDRDLYALLHRGIAHLHLGQYRDAVADLERAAELARITGRPAAQLACRAFLGGALASLGELSAMREQAEQAVALAEHHGWARSPSTAHAYMLVGWSAYLQADTPTAQHATANAVASLGAHNDPGVELSVRSLELIVTTPSDRAFDAMQRYRATLARLADAQMTPAVVAYAFPHLVRICLDLGERQWAHELAETARLRSPSPGEPLLLRAMILHAAGSTDAARREVDRITRHEVPCHLLTTEVEAWLLGAEIDQRLGHATRAHQGLLEALTLANPLDLAVPFVTGEHRLELLHAGRGRFGRHEPFVERLTTHHATRSHGGEQELDRLTAGELAVLRELPSRLTQREIAAARSVSVNTVKTHVRAIYRKLDVEGRREAVEAAHRRGLI